MSAMAVLGPAAELYEGSLVHRRRIPRVHDFHRRVWMPLLDVERLDQLPRLWPLWSSRRAAMIRHRREDYGGDHRHGPPDPRSLAQQARDIVEEQTGVRPLGPVRLLAHARTWGWLFNPMAVYFCYGRDGQTLAAAVLEVTSTPWGERHHYVLDVRDGGTRTFAVDKRMHVSPFLPMDLVYDIRLSPPGERCAIAITVRRGETVVFSAAMALRRRPFTAGRLLLMLLCHPLMTHRVSFAIYAQALRLRRSGVPYIPRPPADSVTATGRSAR
jgi:DUF1365 family protein